VGNINKELKDFKVKTDRTGFSTPSSQLPPGIIEIPLRMIQTDPQQPRKEFDQEKLMALAETIKSHGLIQPIIVRLVGENVYMILAGERRYQAYRLLERAAIPAIVKVGELNEVERLKLALIENLHREDLNALETAESIYRLKQAERTTQRELGVIVGQTEGNVSKYISLYETARKYPELVDKIKKYGLKKSYDTYCKVRQVRTRTLAPTVYRLVVDLHDAVSIQKALEEHAKIGQELTDALSALCDNGNMTDNTGKKAS